MQNKNSVYHIGPFFEVNFLHWNSNKYVNIVLIVDLNQRGLAVCGYCFKPGLVFSKIIECVFQKLTTITDIK